MRYFDEEQYQREHVDRIAELEAALAEAACLQASLADSINGALRNAGLAHEQVSSPADDPRDHVWAMSYKVVQLQQALAEAKAEIRRRTADCEAARTFSREAQIERAEDRAAIRALVRWLESHYIQDHGFDYPALTGLPEHAAAIQRATEK